MQTSQFTEHDFTVEVYNHRTIEYLEEPNQNFLLILWDKQGTFRANCGGFERADQADIAAIALVRGLSLGFNTRDIAVVYTNEYHEVKPDAEV